MIRKVLFRHLIVICIVANLFSVFAFAEEERPVYNPNTVNSIMASTSISELKAKASVLMDAYTGQVLYENKSNEKLPIASVTKVMSMLLAMEAIDSGKISLKDMVTASEYASGMGGSQAYIEPGEQYSVHDALKAIALHSSNDVTVSVAELVAGSEEAFVVQMNEKAGELGMKNTLFKDCTGLTDEGHFSSANDIALMSRELVTKHPKILEYSSVYTDTFRNGEFDLTNTNRLVKFYSGCDGLKTGFTRAAGFCLSATVSRNNMRLISVVLGEPDSNTRFAETRKLLDYGFANYETADVNKKGELVSEISVKKGLTSKAAGVIGNDVKILLPRGQKTKIIRQVALENSITAPLKAGQKVGEIIYMIEEKEISRVDIVSDRNIEKTSFMNLFSRMFKSWFSIGKA
ncbi:D-alanyl-D-alanine carboxypeptidase family protein [Acetivibrio cellulolyticus]|uniref:D-alanyl-D-alanine carboxypeptidase family protein n=1 Tax=Acetivibrio cellulolyticus TaxID=35830 RepID=UPI0001E2DECE|nr:D-alanyl-D-alanine carboxypeptidase family protein [Acetivibrio cellulolyticus]